MQRTWPAVLSLAILSLLTAELLFPQRAARPWWGRKGLWIFGTLLALASALGLWLLGFVLFRNTGFIAPPLIPYLGTLAVAVGLVALGLR